MCLPYIGNCVGYDLRWPPSWPEIHRSNVLSELSGSKDYIFQYPVVLSGIYSDINNNKNKITYSNII